MMDTLPALVGNLVSVPVLAFLLGLLAAAVRTDLRLPDAAYQAISIYLLLAIGLKGGVALREASLDEVVGPIAAAIVLGIVIPIAAFWILRALTPLGTVDRGAMAAHYGSTSLVTFTAALVFLEASAIEYEGFMVTLLTVLEVPGIIVGLLLASRARSGAQPWRTTLAEVLVGRSILLLAGGLAIGFATGPAGYEKVQPFFGALFTGVLALFLLEMGAIAGRRLGDVRTAGIGLVGVRHRLPAAGRRASAWRPALAVGLSVGRRDRPRRAVRERLVHRRAGGRAARPARGQPGDHADREPRHHLPLQPRPRHTDLLRHLVRARARHLRSCPWDRTTTRRTRSSA